MPPIRLLTDADLQVLNELVDSVRKQSLSTRHRPAIQEQIDSAPDVGVVLAPTGGIPARSGLVPGSVTQCTVWRVVEIASVSTLVQTELAVDVYNAFGAVPAGAWCIVARDRFGRWQAMPLGTSSEINTGTSTEPVISGFTGCLSRENKCTGAREYERYESGVLVTVDDVPCGDCDSVLTGTGTGTFGGCPCDPDCIQFTLSGLQDNFCAGGAAYLNGTYQLPNSSRCLWITSKTFRCGAGVEQTAQFSGGYTTGGYNFVITLSGVQVAVYTFTGHWDCSSPIVLNRVEPATNGADAILYFKNYPSTITLTLCTFTGTGTGTVPPPHSGGSQVFTASGTFHASITGPHLFKGWGAAGTGAPGNFSTQGGGGGGGGEYREQTINLTAGQTCNIVIATTSAQDTTVADPTTAIILRSKPGQNGVFNTGGAGGTGGVGAVFVNGNPGANESGGNGGVGGTQPVPTGTPGGVAPGGAGGTSGTPAGQNGGGVAAGGGGAYKTSGSIGLGGRGQVEVFW